MDIPGILTGLVTSIVAWLLVKAFFRPRLRWSSRISKKESDSHPCGAIYQAKLLNVGWCRSIVDIRLDVTIGTRLDEDKGLRRRARMEVRSSTDEVIQLIPGAARLISLDPSEITEFTKRNLANHDQEELANNEKRSLEDLMSAGSDSFLQIRALAVDGWSGAEALYESPQYTLDDILARTFNADGGPVDQWVQKVRDKTQVTTVLARLRPGYRRLELATKAESEGK